MTTSPIDVGSMLFTLVDPHRGHEVAYHRWYERDHFYAGCMIGAGNFAGRRWVAPRRCKDQRFLAEGNPVASDPLAGSYLALYWVLAGMHDEWNRWAWRQLKQLHADGRMFEHRDHVHTQLCTRDWVASRDPDPVPAALALDHPFKGLLVLAGEATGDRAALDAWYREEHLPQALPGSAAALCVTFTPLPVLVDAPGVRQDAGSPQRFVQLRFLDEDPLERPTREGFEAEAAAVDATGLGRLWWAGPFIPTIPGTDAWADELW